MVIGMMKEMRLIPGGEIVMRDDRKKKIWTVTVEPFYLSSHLVTQEQYVALMGANPSAFVGQKKPVDSVSWFDAITFCNLASRAENLEEVYVVSDKESVLMREGADGYRLPSEAEWQHACKAGTSGPRYGNLPDIAWFRDNSSEQTHDVGLKQPNAWELYDMLGNVWEWCWDVYDEKVYGTYRVFRGGGWNDLERGCLATNRRRGHPTFCIDDLGIRLARSNLHSLRFRVALPK